MTAVIPQYWQDETATITDDQVDKLNAVLNVKYAVGVLLVLFPILGFLMVLSFGFMLIQANRAEQSSGLVQMTTTQIYSEKDEKAV